MTPGLSASHALTVIAELAQDLACSRDLDASLLAVVQRIGDTMQAEAASLFLLNADATTLVCRFSVGPTEFSGQHVALGQGVIGRAMQTGVCQLVSNTDADSDFNGSIDAKSGFHTRSLLCMPLGSAQGAIGALEVLNKRDGAVFGPADALLLRALAAPVALAISNARLAVEAVEHERLRRELLMARRMQRSLLPARRRDSFPILALNRPAREVSGDFYDYFELVDGKIGFTIGDVAGKGLDAALLMVRVASLLRWAGKEGLTPARWLTRVNDELCSCLPPGQFVCALAGYYHPGSNRVVWASGGFLPVVRYQAGVGLQCWSAENPPLGILAGLDYVGQEADLAGAELYLFSDGATDARRADRSMLGLDGMLALISAAAAANTRPQARLRQIADALRQLQLGDDTTLMVISGTPA